MCMFGKRIQYSINSFFQHWFSRMRSVWRCWEISIHRLFLSRRHVEYEGTKVLHGNCESSRFSSPRKQTFRFHFAAMISGVPFSHQLGVKERRWQVNRLQHFLSLIYLNANDWLNANPGGGCFQGRSGASAQSTLTHGLEWASREIKFFSRLFQKNPGRENFVIIPIIIPPPPERKKPSRK